jgi:hypothetical protein
MEDSNIPSYCEIRAKADVKRRKNIAGTRLEIQATPYNGSITQEQLNMRRKAEILKYNSTQTNSQTNAPTRKEVFSQIMRGSYKRCTVDTRSIPVSTTASDIPGKPVYLFEDTSVQLYNHRNIVTFGLSRLPPPTDEDKVEDTATPT